MVSSENEGSTWLGTDRLIGLGILAGGVLGLWGSEWLKQNWLHHELLPELLHSLGEALMISGVIALWVDWPLKRRLLKEVTSGLFVHMLGYDLPHEVRKRLTEIVSGTHLYVPEKNLRCHIKRLDEEWVEVQIEETYNVVNDTPVAQQYIQEVVFEKGEQPTKCTISMSADGESYDHSQIDEHPDDPDLLRVGPRSVAIPGKNSRHFRRCFCMKRRADAWQELFQTTPVMKVILKLSADDGLYVAAPKGAYGSEGEYVYAKLFMPGEHITFRWRPTKIG